MADFDKFSSDDLADMLHHYDRTKKNDNYNDSIIHKELLELDRQSNYAPAGRNVPKYVRDTIKKIPRETKLRKDAVMIGTWVITQPQAIPKELSKDFFKEVYEFSSKHYAEKSGLGDKVVVSAYVHYSEMTPHMHFCFIPVIQDENGKQKLCAKDLINREELHSYQVELAKHIEEKGLCKFNEMMTGKTIKDENGRALSNSEFKQYKNRQRTKDRWTQNEIKKDKTMERWG